MEVCYLCYNIRNVTNLDLFFKLYVLLLTVLSNYEFCNLSMV